MNTKGKSTLFGQVGKLVGFGFAEHPILGDSFIEVVFYQTKTEYVICLTEGEMAGMSLRNRATLQSHGLGQDVPGEDFAPFATRSIESTTLSYESFKQIMNETLPQSMPGVKLEWYK